jgi:Na+:H+ antiporter
MELYTALLLLAGLLILASLIQRLAARTTLPASILLAAAGAAIGGVVMLIEHVGGGGPIEEAAKAFTELPVGSEVFLYVFLPALLFQSALTIEVRQIFQDAAPILLLAVIAVVVATGVIGLALAPMAGVPMVACLMLGAIVATTDPVAVIAIFRDIGAPARLTRLLEGESLLNDAAAITLFGVLLGILRGTGTASFLPATVSFLWTFAGGIVVGFAGARLVVLLLGWLGDLRFAQVTLTLALPYLVFIASEHGLHVSGVVAAVTAGLVCSAIGQPRIAPADWRFLNEVWEQLAFWASSLIFLLAALLVPRLLANASSRDAMLLAMLVAAALVARALVLYGLLPVLSGLGLSQRINHRYKTVILWGGLRGAVTLALVLAVRENRGIDPEVQRFIAVLATGFVLFTLIVNGLTLRPVIRMLRLDRLSPFDQALRTQVLSLSQHRVVQAVQTIGREYGFPDELTTSVADDYRTYHAGKKAGPATTVAGDDEDQLRLGLLGLANRERELVLEHFSSRTVSGRVVEELLADAERLIDRTHASGREGYFAAAGDQLSFSRRFRFGHMLHRRFRIDGPLVDRLGDRFERLLVSRVVLEELGPYVATSLAPLVGDRVTPKLRLVLDQRRQMADAALEAFRAQYAQFSDLLERRFLRRVALRREDGEYRKLFQERLIGPELYTALRRELRTARVAVEVRPRLDLGLETRGLVRHVPLFAGLDAHQIDQVAHLLQPRMAMPDERLISEGERGDRMYFISSGVVEAVAAGQRFLLTRGDFFGEMALVLDVPRQANVTALSYCQLLVLESRDFHALLRHSPGIKHQIDQAASARAQMNEAVREEPSA